MSRRLRPPTLLLVGWWIALQLIGPLSLIALAAGDHELRLGSTAGSLVLSHDHGRSGARSHEHERTGADSHGLVAFLAPPGAADSHHGDHVVRMPHLDRATRPGIDCNLAGAPEAVAFLQLEAPRASSSRIVPSRAPVSSSLSRSRPLLL